MNPQKNLEKLLEHFLEVGPAGCALRVTHHGKEIFTHSTGYADIENKIPLRPDSIVRLFSNTKVFTVVALMTLYEQGKFLLSDPLETYLPEFSKPMVASYAGSGAAILRPAKRSIQIRDLFTMTSGLPYGNDFAGPYTTTHIRVEEALQELEGRGGYSVRDFSRRIAQVPLLFDPGSSWCYGLSHDVLGALIEVLSDMDFESYLKKVILDPLGLADTSFFIDDVKLPRLARQYTAPDASAVRSVSERLDYYYRPEHAYMSGGAGLLSTLDDLSRFAAMLSMGGTLDGVRILGRKTIDLMRRNHLTPAQTEAFVAAQENGWDFMRGYGYGLGVRTMIDPVAAGSNGSIGEFGWAGAAGTWIMVDPSEGLSAAYVQQEFRNPHEGYCHPRLRNAVYALLE